MANETTTCPVCSNDVESKPAARTYDAPFNGVKYTLYCCKSCGLGYWTPLRIDAAFYEDEGFAAYSDYHQGGRPFPPWCEAFFEKMPLKKGTLLDVGCGDGAFLSRAQSAGFEVWGMDLDKNSVRTAVALYDLKNVTQSSLADFVAHCKENSLTFDVISFFEVLEHQDNPSQFIGQVLSILKPGGFIAGSVPNGERILAPVDRKMSAGDLPPHHFLWFSKKTLETLFFRHKFLSILVHASGNISLLQVQEKFSKLLLRRYEKNGQKSLFLRKALFPVVLCASVLIWVLYKIKPAHLYFQAEKPDA